MKWCFLVNSAQFLPEFFGKLTGQAVKEKDECLVIFSSKTAEYSKKIFFPDRVKFICAIDWFINHCDKSKEDFFGLSWKDFFTLFYRNRWEKINYKKAVETSQCHVQFFRFIFEAEKPDIIIAESPSSFFHAVAYHFSKINNVPYLGMEISKIEDRLDIYDSGFACSRYEKTFNNLTDNDIHKDEKEYAQKFVKGFISHKISPDAAQMNKIQLNQVSIVKHYLSRFKEDGAPLLKYFLKRGSFKKFDSESESVLKAGITAPFRMEKRQFKIALQKNIYSKLKDWDKKFFLYPLHFQPESTTLIFATYYNDQLNTIKNIAFSLPFPYKLYVKEHPSSVGTRPKIFYDKIKKLPNVVLIGPEADPEKLIKKSQGVIVLTGTMGMEAALSGKPAYIFGNVYYSYHPFCRRLNNFDELRDRIMEDLAVKPDISKLENINNRFVVSYLRNTIRGNILSASSLVDKNNYAEILNSLRMFSTPVK